MALLPKIERVTKNVTIVHFLLLFGYKTFSLYFPLFLIVRGFSLPEVGYTYLLIYLPIALFSPVAGFLNHKVNPAILSSIGILGYGIYALGMIFIPTSHTFGIALFYLWQILLGVSAAIFFVSIRAIFMGYPLENPNRAFGWFYSAPFYVDALAPVIGAFFVWQFNFVGVFLLSIALHLFTAAFCFLKLKKPGQVLPDQGFSFREFKDNNQEIFRLIKKRTVLPFVLTSFSVLLLGGFYRAYFVLFLKESLLWSQNFILIFVSVLSLLFLPISLFLIRHLEKFQGEKNIFQGGLVAGFFSILFGSLVSVLNFFSVLLVDFARGIGSFLCNAGRSGLLTQRLKGKPEEAGAIDTVFAPLGVALGALISGTIIGFLGYGPLFILGGIFVIFSVLFLRCLSKEKI
jgi:MFS family permease